MNDRTREKEPNSWRKAAEIIQTIATSRPFSQEEVSGIPPEARKHKPELLVHNHVAALTADSRRCETSTEEHVSAYCSFLTSPYATGHDGVGTVWPLALHISPHHVPPSWAPTDGALSSLESLQSLPDADDRSSVTLAEGDLPMTDAKESLLIQPDDHPDGSDQEDETVRAMSTPVTSDEEAINLVSSNKAAKSIQNRIRPCPEGYTWSNMRPGARQYLAEQSGQPVEYFSVVKCFKAYASFTTSFIWCPYPGCMFLFEPRPEECNFEPHFMWHRVMEHSLEQCYCGAFPTDLSLHFGPSIVRFAWRILPRWVSVKLILGRVGSWSDCLCVVQSVGNVVS